MCDKKYFYRYSFLAILLKEVGIDAQQWIQMFLLRVLKGKFDIQRKLVSKYTGFFAGIFDKYNAFREYWAGVGKIVGGKDDCRLTGKIAFKLS